MARAKIYIDGASGTTGLKVADRLATRTDIELITLDESLRKDVAARAQALHDADVAFLCLPDDAAREAVALAADTDTVIIDASTAHRTDPAWTYGFPELATSRDAIAMAKRIANPGCHASGFIALVAPLVRAGIVPADANLSAVSLTGYSGGGKKMIADYEAAVISGEYAGPRAYGLSQSHKHLPEMMAVCGLANAPVFLPVVEPFYSGMMVTVPLCGAELRAGAKAAGGCGVAAGAKAAGGCGVAASAGIRDVEDALAAQYNNCDGGLVRFVPQGQFEGFICAADMFGRDDMIVTVCGNDERMSLVSVFDNLGKGACGAAIQNMNIVLGVDETTGLNVGRPG